MIVNNTKLQAHYTQHSKSCTQNSTTRFSTYIQTPNTSTPLRTDLFVDSEVRVSYTILIVPDQTQCARLYNTSAEYARIDVV